jgi:hypothetical protein
MRFVAPKSRFALVPLDRPAFRSRRSVIRVVKIEQAQPPQSSFYRDE